MEKLTVKLIAAKTLQTKKDVTTLTKLGKEVKEFNDIVPFTHDGIKFLRMIPKKDLEHNIIVVRVVTYIQGERWLESGSSQNKKADFEKEQIRVAKDIIEKYHWQNQ